MFLWLDFLALLRPCLLYLFVGKHLGWVDVTQANYAFCLLQMFLRNSLKAIVILIFILDGDLHANKGIIRAQIYNILISQTDASLACPSRNTLFIIGAAVYAYAAMPWSHQSCRHASSCHPSSCQTRNRNGQARPCLYLVPHKHRGNSPSSTSL